MAFEQQNNAYIDKTNQFETSKQKSQSSQQLELLSNDGTMNVSYYYIPHMSSIVEAQRVRKALLPFIDNLIEHCIDLDARHLTLYHHSSIDDVTLALQRLSLGAELQQTMSHYEPLEMMVFEKQSSNHIDQTQSKNNHSVLIVQKIFTTMLEKLRRWINALRNKKDR
ncbi:cobalt transporter [Acinetobacter beijerinckii]|uniref:cobalt transporter n=1 Tax=Acinetobacter beijerinckii TaxID=262668 RepID=UPI0040551370